MRENRGEDESFMGHTLKHTLKQTYKQVLQRMFEKTLGRKASLPFILTLVVLASAASPLHAADISEQEKAKALDQQRVVDLTDPIGDAGQLAMLRISGDEAKAKAADTKIYAETEAILQKDPGNYFAWAFLSRLKSMDKADGSAERTKSLTLLGQNIKAHPTWAFQYGSRGNIYESYFHENDSARADYQKAMALTSDTKEKNFYVNKIAMIDQKRSGPQKTSIQ